MRGSFSEDWDDLKSSRFQVGMWRSMGKGAQGVGELAEYEHMITTSFNGMSNDLTCYTFLFEFQRLYYFCLLTRLLDTSNPRGFRQIMDLTLSHRL